MRNRKDRIPLADGFEQDALTGWRRLLCVFYNNTGLTKAMKRRYNKRARKEAKYGIENQKG